MSNRNSFFSVVNLLERAASVTVTNRDPSTPATNAVDGRLKTVLRANAPNTSLVLGADLGAPEPIRVLFAGEVNWPAGAEWRLRLSNSAIGAFDVLDTGFVTADVPVSSISGLPVSRQQAVMHFPTAVTARYCEIAVRDPGATGAILEYGWLWPGRADFEPAIGADYRARFGYQPRDLVQTTEGGVDFVDRRRGFWQWFFGFNNLTHAEAMRTALDIDAGLSLARPFLFVPYMHASNLSFETLLGRFGAIDLVEVPDVVHFAKAYQLREALSAQVSIAWT